MRELAIVANTKKARIKSSYCNFKKNEREIVAKQTRLLQDLII